MNRIFILTLGAALLPLLSTARADEASEAKMRENLKNISRQLETAKQETAALRLAQTALEATKKTLEEQVKTQARRIDEMDKEMKGAKATAERIQGEQTAKIARLDAELAKFTTSLDKWQAAHATITGMATKKEAERAKLSARAADLERKLTDCRAKNSELYKLGMEILERYKRFGIGDALAAREPFTGNAKVKLQNLVQDYGDKLLDQTAKP